VIDEKEVTAYVTMPDCFLQGCSEDIVIFRADGGNHFTDYGIYEECFFSLTGKNALRKEGFPVTSILPEMTDPSTGCRIRTSTDTSTWED
jgi:hypothetical protein